MTPGPLGIFDTNPTAEAPYVIAFQASSIDWMQQILTRGLFVGFKVFPPGLKIAF